MLRAEKLCAGYAGRAVLRDIELDIAPGTFTAILGPNGSGKSTLLKCLARLIAPLAGRVLFEGHPLEQLEHRAFARQVALLPQAPSAPPELTVFELAAMGRHPHLPWLGRLMPADRDIVMRALERCGLVALAGRRLPELSGGERQRAWIAMALAQETRALLLDEPVSFLDIRYQLETMELLGTLNRERKLTVVAVLHEINNALRHAQRIVVMDSGKIGFDGPAPELLRGQALSRAFGVKTWTGAHPSNDAPYCFFSLNAAT